MNGFKDPEEKNRVEGGTLYLVATPIGNLSDLSARAVKILSQVDLVAAEDTRNSAKLLSLLGISRPMISYFEHNKAEHGKKILEKLLAGQSVALVTDAGTPAVSDPGADLVKLCIENGVPVTSAPGCCAAINALVLSGLDTRRFLFEGFLEGSESDRRETLESLRAVRRTMIFYEAPHRLMKTLLLMREVFSGQRKAAFCREMTKINEEVLRCTLDEAIEYFTQNPPRGEFVLIVQGREKEESPFFAQLTVEEHVSFYVGQGLSKMDAMKAAARDRGVGKGEIYRALLKE